MFKGKGPPPKPIVLKKCGAEQDDEECPKGPKLPWSNNLLDMYLVMLQEKEWNDTGTENEIYNDKMRKHLRKMIGDLAGVDDMDDIRQAFQPSTYDIYLKNVIGDYRGRINQLNARRVYTFGYDEIKEKLPSLLARKKKAMSKNIVPKKTWDNLKKIMYNTDMTELHNDVAI